MKAVVRSHSEGELYEIRKNDSVRYELASGGLIDVKLTDQGLEIAGVDLSRTQLVVIPRVSNVVNISVIHYSEVDKLGSKE